MKMFPIQNFFSQSLINLYPSTIAFVAISILHCNLYAQSGIIDPYKLDFVDYTGPFPQIGPIPEYVNQSQELVYYSALPDVIDFDGEYMILLREHPFGNQISGQLPFAQTFPLSYKMEIVSFPFSIDCWNQPFACSSPNPERHLKMPIESYNTINEGWGSGTDPALYLHSKRDEGQFNINLAQIQLGFMSGGDDHPEALVSTAFVRDENVILSNWRYVLPHTIIKHTVYIHCDVSPYFPIDSIQWVYDNTRGRMRKYPFNYDNSDVGNQASLYDVIFIPEIITAPANSFGYLRTFNDDWIDGGTIDYSNFDPSLQSAVSCISSDNNYFPGNLQMDNFRSFLNGTFILDYGDTPPFSILNTTLRNANGEYFAGYKNVNDLLDVSLTFQGVKHNYFIDKDFDTSMDGIIDLTILSKIDKTIYNPSEVTLDPDAGDPGQNNPPIEVIFPEGYTFKTVLGRYPSFQQVEDANNDPQNGGYYSDPRQVPVPVNAADLTPVPDPVNYPEVMWNDPTTPIDDRYGYYYVEDKATLTVEKCVRIFDAIFKVNEGGTLRFNHYLGILGYEDTDMNNGRYKIIGNKGAILRNYKQIQYVQNGNISQSIPLNYIATEQIIAGKDVDIDNDQPKDDFKILSGADVTFTAGVYIHLQDGFSVQGGDFHAVIDENMYVPLFCDQSTSQGGNRISNQEQQVNNSNVKMGVVISPNPNTGSFKIESMSEEFISSIIIYDAIGKQVFFKNEINLTNYDLTLSSEIKGILIVKTTHSNGVVTSSKIAVH